MSVWTLFYCEQHLHKMHAQRYYAEYAAACQHLYEQVVIHVREDPIFNVIRPVRGDRFVEPHAEDGRAQEIFDAALPDEEPARIAETAVEIDCQKLADKVPHYYKEHNAAHKHHAVEYAHKFAYV